MGTAASLSKQRDQSEEAAACIVCKAALTSIPAVQLRAAKLCECACCGTWTYLPRPSSDEQAALHDNDKYFEHPYFELRRNAEAQRRRCLDVIARIGAAVDLASLRDQTWLDIGCDTGLLLTTAREELGIIPIGLDVSKRAIEIARQRGVEAFQLSIETAPPELADLPVATAVDLIEHLPAPGEFLRQVRSRICLGGVLYLETPNIRSVVYRFGQMMTRVTRSWPTGLIERLFPPQHIQYFTAQSLATLARDAGFEVVSLTRRFLPPTDMAASPWARLPIAVLQACDRVIGTEILLCAILRRPFDAPGMARP